MRKGDQMSEQDEYYTQEELVKVAEVIVEAMNTRRFVIPFIFVMSVVSNIFLCWLTLKDIPRPSDLVNLFMASNSAIVSIGVPACFRAYFFKESMEEGIARYKAGDFTDEQFLNNWIRQGIQAIHSDEDVIFHKAFVTRYKIARGVESESTENEVNEVK